jgi:hypothetical protein
MGPTFSGWLAIDVALLMTQLMPSFPSAAWKKSA